MNEITQHPLVEGTGPAVEAFNRVVNRMKRRHVIRLNRSWMSCLATLLHNGINPGTAAPRKQGDKQQQRENRLHGDEKGCGIYQKW